MLAADKLQLQSTFKQQATALKEKEFNLHHNNFMTIGTQAAVLAGRESSLFVGLANSLGLTRFVNDKNRVERIGCHNVHRVPTSAERRMGGNFCDDPEDSEVPLLRRDNIGILCQHSRGGPDYHTERLWSLFGAAWS